MSIKPILRNENSLHKDTNVHFNVALKKAYDPPDFSKLELDEEADVPSASAFVAHPDAIESMSLTEEEEEVEEEVVTKKCHLNIVETPKETPKTAQQEEEADEEEEVEPAGWLESILPICLYACLCAFKECIEAYFFPPPAPASARMLAQLSHIAGNTVRTWSEAHAEDKNTPDAPAFNPCKVVLVVRMLFVDRPPRYFMHKELYTSDNRGTFAKNFWQLYDMVIAAGDCAHFDFAYVTLQNKMSSWRKQVRPIISVTNYSFNPLEEKPKEQVHSKANPQADDINEIFTLFPHLQQIGLTVEDFSLK